jgi:hypothetical protein
MKKFLIILLLYYPIDTYSQGWSFEYSAGYGTYKLTDIKNLQHSMLDNSMLNYYGLKETDCFPGYIIHSVALGYVAGSHHFGAGFSFFTTGGRLHRADYSGSYTVDMIMNGNRLGAFYRYNINSKAPDLNFYLQLGSGIMFSNLKMKEQVIIYSESKVDTEHLNGLGIYLEPVIGAKYCFTNWLNLSLGGGYEADFLGTLKLSEQETQLKARWNGLRLYGGIIFILPAKKKSLYE